VGASAKIYRRRAGGAGGFVFVVTGREKEQEKSKALDRERHWGRHEQKGFFDNCEVK
jgi:hypothetical protein